MMTNNIESKRAAWKLGMFGVAIMLFAAMQGCGGSSPTVPPGVGPGPQADGTVVRGVAIVTVTNSQETALGKLYNLIMPRAFAATGSTSITYVNAASVNFTINAAAFAPAGFTGDTLSLGTVSLASLDDNKLKVCAPGGSSKCTQAIIRVYTTGTLAGFVNSADNFGAPVYAGTLNPTSPVGLNSAGSVQVQTVSIAGNKNRLRLTDLASPTYPVNADFSNAGEGNYSMTFVVEYALAP